MLAFGEESPETFEAHVNVKWTLNEDLFHPKEKPSAVMIPGERTAELAGHLRSLEYFTDQKAYVSQSMQNQSDFVQHSKTSHTM